MIDFAHYPIVDKISSTTGTNAITHQHLTTQKVQPLVDAEIFADTLREFWKIFENNPSSESIKSIDNIELPNALSEKFQSVTGELKFDLSVKSIIEEFLIQLYVKNNNQSIILSKSADDQFLMYTNESGTYRNLLIDEDGDVELLIIPPDRKKTFNQMFFKSKGFNYSEIISKLNAMQ